MNPHSAFTFEIPQRHCHGKLRRDAQQHVDMVRLGIPFHQTNFLLPPQVPQNSPDLLPPLSEEHPLTVLWNDHNVVLYLQSHFT